ncbi:MAG: hypothetical protein AAF078_02805 [Planctomycetota bacterium]
MSVARPTESPAQAAKLAVLVVAWLAVVHTPDAGAAMVVSAAMSAHSQSVAWAQSIRRSTPTVASHVVRPRKTLGQSLAIEARPAFELGSSPSGTPRLAAHLLNLPPPSA